MVHAGLSTFEHPASPCREQTNHSGQNQHYCIRNMGWISPEQGSHAVAWKGSDLFGSDWLWHPAVCWRAQIFGHGCHQGGWATVLYPGLLWGLERCPPPPQSNKNVHPPSPLDQMSTFCFPLRQSLGHCPCSLHWPEDVIAHIQSPCWIHPANLKW